MRKAQRRGRMPSQDLFKNMVDIRDVLSAEEETTHPS
jgi:hypothetical protein